MGEKAQDIAVFCGIASSGASHRRLSAGRKSNASREAIDANRCLSGLMYTQAGFRSRICNMSQVIRFVPPAACTCPRNVVPVSGLGRPQDYTKSPNLPLRIGIRIRHNETSGSMETDGLSSFSMMREGWLRGYEGERDAGRK